MEHDDGGDDDDADGCDCGASDDCGGWEAKGEVARENTTPMKTAVVVEASRAGVDLDVDEMKQEQIDDTFDPNWWLIGLRMMMATIDHCQHGSMASKMIQSEEEAVEPCYSDPHSMQVASLQREWAFSPT